MKIKQTLENNIIYFIKNELPFCLCGCNKRVTKKGNRYISGHNKAMLGIKHSNKTKLKMSNSQLSKEVQEKKRQTNLKNRNCDNPMQDPAVRQKGIQTNRQKRNYDYPMQDPEVRKKHADKLERKTGYRYPSQIPIIKEKISKIFQKKFGGLSPYSSEEVKEKGRQTSLENWNFDNPMKNIEIQEKQQNTMIINHGFKNASQVKKFQEKKIKTWNMNWNCENPSQSSIIKEKKRKTFIEHFGVDHWAKSKEGLQFHRIDTIKRIEQQKLHGEPLMPCVGIQERLVLNELQKYTIYNIIRQDPSFKYNIGRIPDGYIQELKLIILYQEQSEHYKNKECTILKEDTILTTKDYESITLRVFEISEYQWKHNKEKVIHDFKEIINYIEQQEKDGRGKQEKINTES